MTWPDGKAFAFTIFDDPDAQNLDQSRSIYSFLSDLGYLTTLSVWTIEPGLDRRNSAGETCANPQYRAWVQELQRRGFEIGFHNAAPATLDRAETLHGLDRFREYFGHDPRTMANHYNGEAIYWGPQRLTGLNRALYGLMTLGRTRNKHFGEEPGHRCFWGDLCKDRIRYCRNFVVPELNTLEFCPWMPYRDEIRPYVNGWFASSDGANVSSFLRLTNERAVDRLEESRGAAIVYTHFGHGYCNGGLDERFQSLMRKLSKRNGWFVPVGVLLEYLESQGNGKSISERDRSKMERQWLWNKLFRGTS